MGQYVEINSVFQENTELTLHNAKRALGLALGVLVRVHRGVALDEDEGAGNIC